MIIDVYIYVYINIFAYL